MYKKYFTALSQLWKHYFDGNKYFEKYDMTYVNLEKTLENLKISESLRSEKFQSNFCV